MPPLTIPRDPGDPPSTYPSSWRLEPEYRDAWRAYDAAGRTPAAASAALKAIDPLVRAGAATYGGSASPLVRGRARMIAADALTKYDPEKASLRTHVMAHMRGLQRHAAKRDRFVAVPERLLLDRARVYAATAALRDDLGREPSDAELADHARVPLSRLAAVRSYSGSTTPGGREAAAAAAGFDADDLIIDDPRAGERRAEALYHELNPIDQLILERSVGLRGSPRASGREIAAALGISPSAVTQRAARIQAKLDELADSGILP